MFLFNMVQVSCRLKIGKLSICSCFFIFVVFRSVFFVHVWSNPSHIDSFMNHSISPQPGNPAVRHVLPNHAGIRPLKSLATW